MLAKIRIILGHLAFRDFFGSIEGTSCLLLGLCSIALPGRKSNQFVYGLLHVGRINE